MDEPIGTVEAWLPVVHYEKLYKVSDLGNVLSLEKLVVVPYGETGRNEHLRIVRSRMMKPYHVSGKAGGHITLSTDGDCIGTSVARIVWRAFIGKIPVTHYVDHIRDNGSDALCNLRLIIRSVRYGEK